jgi:tetratricopeptide (TPR) repeat protein
MQLGQPTYAADPAGPPAAPRPPWQRLLQGDDAKKAAELGGRLVAAWEGGTWEEALRAAEQLLALRQKVQGTDHWEAVNARWQVEALRAAQRQSEEVRKEYAGLPDLQRQADALVAGGRYREAQPVLEKILAVRRKVLGEEHPYTAASSNNLAHSLNAQGKYAAAEEGSRQALAIRRKTLGEEHPDTAAGYYNLASILNAQGRFAAAAEGYRQALAVNRKTLGEEHPQTARSYNGLAVNLQSQWQYAAAEGFARQALAIRLKVLGEKHPDTAASYTILAFNLHVQGQYAAAEENYSKALAIRLKVLGEAHPDTADSYSGLAFNHYVQGQYAAAELGLRRALAIRLKVLGGAHPDTAKSCNFLSTILYAQGQYAAAEGFARQALAVCRKALGEDHPDTGLSYHNLAADLQAQGQYAAAEGFARQALAIFRKALGEDHPNTAESYNNLSASLNAQGQYAASVEGYLQALTIQRKVFGEDHRLTAQSYNNLAASLTTQGQYAAAEEFARRALAIHRKVLGEEHPHTATMYNNLVVNLQKQGRYPAAEEFARQALAVRRKVLGEEHPLTASSYNNLAISLQNQGQHAAAEEGYRKALAIRRKNLGEDHPDTATSYNSLGSIFQNQGQYAAAEEFARKALVIRRKSFGEEHPETAQSYNNLASNLNAQGRYAEAAEFWLRAADAFAKARPRLAHSGLEGATVTGERSPLPALAAVLARNGKPAQAWRRYEESLARGTWDDLSARLRRPPAEQAKQVALTAQLNRLDQLIAKAVAVRDETPQQKGQREDLLGQRRKAQEELDTFMAYLEKTYGAAAGQVFDTPRIQAALADDTALVGWIDLKPGGPKAADPSGEHWAFLLRRKGDPVCVRLTGSGAGGAWTEEDISLPADLLASLRERRPGWQRPAERLHRQRLGPLAAHLAGVRRLLVLPSAGLAGLPVELFAGECTVSYALSGTLHAHLHGLTRPTSRGLLALADPAFDPPARRDEPPPLPERGVLLTAVLPGSNAARARLRPGDVLLRYHDTDLSGPADFKPLPGDDAAKEVPVTAWRDGRTFETRLQSGKLGVVVAKDPAPLALAEQREQDRRLAALREEKWLRLPGTRTEAEALQRLFEGAKEKPAILLGSQASEQRLDEMAKGGALSKYRYVHLATHGEVDHTWPLRSAALLARDQLPDAGKQLEAGLPVYDARLSAEEVLRAWNLHCELVTLSACQSALGRYEHGEGFVGFAQAFLLCGSRAVCLSLWPVDDAATALLMQRFYANLLGRRAGLEAPLGKAAALAEARAWLRELSAEEALALSASLRQGLVRKKDATGPQGGEKPAFGKGAKPYAHPYYWSAFVLIGDPE